MDFHSLSRRDLQALCKRNKIPANITNLAMADALQALHLVEGIEDFLEPSQSETALTRSRRTTRKTVAKDADESQTDVIQTPAAVGQTNRKKSLMASACLKMDFQLKECVEEEKKDALMTPAQLGVTSRRRRGLKEESAVTRVYSTRRSTRLAEKTGAENGQSGLFKNDLHTDMNMNLKDSLDNLDIISEISVEFSEADASKTVEENSDKKDEIEFVSAQQQDISIGDEKEVVCTIEEEMGQHFEADASKPEANESSDVELEEAEVDEEKCDKIEDDSKDEEMEIAVLNTEEDKDTDKDAGHADEVSNGLENIVLESEDNNDKDSEDVSDFNVNEEVLEMNTAVNLEALDSVIVEAEESSDVVVEENEKSLPINEEKHEEVGIVQHEETKKADMDSRLVFQPTRLTPIKNSAMKASSATTFIVSDNKENIGSGGKLILAKESVKIVKNTDEHVSKLDDLSVRKLTKMLKEKLQITSKSSKNENDDEIISHEPAQVVARPALQAIPENR